MNEPAMTANVITGVIASVSACIILAILVEGKWCAWVSSTMPASLGWAWWWRFRNGLT